MTKSKTSNTDSNLNPILIVMIFIISDNDKLIMIT